MKKGMIRKLLPHLIAVGVFLIVAVVYCRPVLSGSVLNQHDVTQWKAMAQNSFEHKEKTGQFPLWTSSMFSGMPAYQIAMGGGSAISPGIFYYVLTLGLPKPISFFFLACICFYFLSQVLRTNAYIGIIGALSFAYATYNPIIIAAGHDTKMQSIAFMPALIGSLILLYERKYWLGGALTALSTALLIGMNHPQIAYYTFLIAAFMTVAYIVYWVKAGEYKHIGLALGIAAVAGVAGLLTNAITIFTTYEYAKESIRGGSELATDKTNSTRSGLSKDYALSYSMYKTEPFVMLVPKMYGGSNAVEIDQEDSKAIEVLQSIPQELGQQLQYNLGSYWGGIGGTSGPPYAGAIICFLTLIGFFLLNNKHKWWILSISTLAFLMSWGSYFEDFNLVLLNVLPMYNKFRAPSMTIVIPTFLFCMMAILTLQAFATKESAGTLWTNYKKGLLLTGGVFVMLLLIYFSADYKSEGDKSLLTQVASAPAQVQEYVRTFFDGLEADRKGLFMGSLLRSLFFIAVAAGILWLWMRKKIGATVSLVLIGILAFIDLMGINTKYLNAENYQDEATQEANFSPTEADTQILADKSYYRVFDIRQGLGVALGMQGAAPSYFHNSIGGYHPAKLSIYQDLIEQQLSKFPASLPVINMLNTKYVIQRDEAGKDNVITNPEALGAAWFVQAMRYENTPQDVMNALTTAHPGDTAIVFKADQASILHTAGKDSADVIQLVANNNDEVTYKSSSAANRFAVFSEIFYSKGWKAFVDEKEVPIIRTNYVLRGLSIPAGQHNIKFTFHPLSYYTGKTLSFIAGLIVLLALVGAAFVTYQTQKRNEIA